MKMWLGLFLLVVGLGVAFGVARDMLSVESGRVEGEIVEVVGGGVEHKSPPAPSARLKVRLADGTTVGAAGVPPGRARIGARVELTRWVTPWGQVWYTVRR